MRAWRIGLLAALIAAALLVPGAGLAHAQTGAPTVTAVAVTSNAGNDQTYAFGETIRVTLTFSEAVDVTGAPQLAIDMDPADWGTKWAGYERGSGTTSLVFAHTVIEPNYSSRGIAVLANTLKLNGGAIKSASSQTDAALGHAGLDHDAAHKVNWRLSRSAPTITDLAITSNAGDDHTYALGETIQITVTFSEAVAVTGTPQLAIDMDPAEWGRKLAGYDSGSGTTSLTFTHTVVEPNYSSRGIAVLANTLDLGGGSIQSAHSQTDAARAHPGLDHDANHKVNWRLSPGEPNRAPVLNSGTRNYDSFVGRNNAPRGVLVSKSFAGLFSDPDGDNLSYTVAISAGRGQLVEQLVIGAHGRSDELAAKSPRPREATMRVFFEADADDDWDAIVPALPERPLITVTLTATDPDGLSASVQGDFLIDWEPDSGCPLDAPSSVTALTIGRGAVVAWSVPDDLADDCEVTGFVVSAFDTHGNSLEALVGDPEARAHTIRGLEPGDHLFSVRITYADESSDDDATSDDLVTAYSTHVPDACITLAVKPYARNGVGGRITSINGTGCAARETFDLELRRAGHEDWLRYRSLSWSLIGSPSDPSLPQFIFYGIDPNVPHEFRISAYDASDNRYETAAQRVTITAQDPSETADANSPTGLHIVVNNDGEMSIRWDAFTAPAGRTLSGFRVQWRRCPLPNVPTGCTSDKQSATRGASDTRHDVTTGLTNGAYYTARVAARTHVSSQDASTATNAWTVWAPAVRVFSEPLQIWFDMDTPKSNADLDRTFMRTESNKNRTSAVCRLNSSGSGAHSINCPPRTLVSLAASGNIFGVQATATIPGGESVSTTPIEGPEVGGPPPQVVRASGGAAASDNNAATHEGRIVIYSSVGPSPNAPGAIAGYQIQQRKQNTDGSWPAWSTTWTDDSKPTERFRTITGLQDGTYQVRVRSRIDNSEDHDNNPVTPNQVVSRHSFTSEVVTVTVAASNTQTALPAPITVTPGNRTLTVEWALLDRGSIPIAYEVRHRAQGTSAWTQSGTLVPRPTTLMCSSDRFGCFNPRRHEITGLTADLPYEVELRARNANGWSPWYASVVRPGPPDTTAPVAVSAVNTSGQTTVVVTFDEPLNPDFVPGPSRFTLGRQVGVVFWLLETATAVSISGSELTLTFSEIPSNATHLNYLFTNVGTLQDLLGNQSDSFTVSLTRN